MEHPSSGTSDLPLERQFRPVEIAYLMRKDVRTVLGWLRDPNHPLTGKKITNQWYIGESHLKKFLNGELND